MINLLPKTSPLSELNKRPNDVLAMLDDGPVMLMQRSTPAGMLISTEFWDKLAYRMQVLEALQEARVNRAKAEADSSSIISGKEMSERMAEHGVILEN